MVLRFRQPFYTKYLNTYNLSNYLTTNYKLANIFLLIHQNLCYIFQLF